MIPHVKIINCLFILCLFGIFTLHSQEKLKTIQDIHLLISQDSLEKTKILVSKNIAFYKNQKQYDSLAEYIQFEGSFKLNNGNHQTAISKAKKLTDFITATGDPKLIKKALTEMGWIYDDAGQTGKAYDLLLQAVEPTLQINEPKNTDAASVQYSLGYYTTKIGNYPLSKKHYLKSLELLKKSKDEDYVFYNQIYNSLGGILWQQTKLDSANYYFQQAIEVLKKTDSTDIKNKYYRPSLLKMNMSIILNALGNNKEAITISYEAIDNLQKYIEESIDELDIKKAKGNLFTALDNLASYHNTIGEFKRSEEIMEYSYAQKQKVFEKNDIILIISHIILAEAKTASRNFEEAAQYADLALEQFKFNAGQDLYWKAAALSTRGSIYERTGNMEMAKKFYELGDQVYRTSLENTYSKEFLDHLIELSKFYVKIGEEENAIATAKEAFDYVRKGTLNKTLQEFYHTQNVAEVYYKLKNYKEAIEYSDKAMQFNKSSNGNRMSSADSILVQYRKPSAIYINTASKFHLEQNKTEENLKNYLLQIEQAIAILEQRRKVVTTHEDVTILINENEELFNFAKKLRLNLFTLTKDENYLDQVISLHESAMYNRIRSRLNLRENIAFKNVPKKVLEKETQLKTNLITTLQNTEKGIGNYISSSEKWEVFVDQLQKNYPDYYKMRYGTVEKPIKDLQEKIPKNTTVVRYLFIEDYLYAFVVNSMSKKLISLDNTIVQGHLEQLAEENFSMVKNSKLLFELYNVLWKPLAENIQTKKIIIVPDRELFNLSFEMLTPKPLRDFEEFTTNSLLANYDISYNFSLLLYKDKSKVIDYPENYIGFVPGFNREMKQDYKISITDSMQLDQAYLTLLPQPYSEKLVKKYSEVFDGTYFMNENASKTIFLNQVKDHKIIHIGTHAESNNLSPELSRLLFAKKSGSEVNPDENSLYVYEIYNTNLSSNLAILTACETGKPSYQPGEGMISLAHAFNYAGSESILTSLWEIDEISSSQIVGYFYDFLSEGLPKDEALKKAKLKYLSTAEGRGASPQYWAGLVLIGDTSPIALQQGANPIWWWVIGLLLVSLLLIYFFRRKKVKN